MYPSFSASHVHSYQLFVCKDDRFKGMDFEFYGEETYTYKEVMELVCEMIGVKPDFVDIPLSLGMAAGKALKMLPNPSLTDDMVSLSCYITASIVLVSLISVF